MNWKLGVILFLLIFQYTKKLADADNRCAKLDKHNRKHKIIINLWFCTRWSRIWWILLKLLENKKMEGIAIINAIEKKYE